MIKIEIAHKRVIKSYNRKKTEKPNNFFKILAKTTPIKKPGKKKEKKGGRYTNLKTQIKIRPRIILEWTYTLYLKPHPKTGNHRKTWKNHEAGIIKNQRCSLSGFYTTTTPSKTLLTEIFSRYNAKVTNLPYLIPH